MRGVTQAGLFLHVKLAVKGVTLCHLPSLSSIADYLMYNVRGQHFAGPCLVCPRPLCVAAERLGFALCCVVCVCVCVFCVAR